MKVLVTGSKGFIGQNLMAELKNRKIKDILEFTRNDSIDYLEKCIKECDFIFHLAGVNRPKKEEEFTYGNYNLTKTIVDLLIKHNKAIPILMTSSVQAKEDNPYGNSKYLGEEELIRYENETKGKALIYRLNNVFGKWCKPNYNSVVATFCYNIAREKDIIINDKNKEMNLVYIDDVINEFLKALNGKENRKGKFSFVEPVYKIKLGEIAEKIYKFKESRNDLSIGNMADGFEKKLYSTYLSYLPEDKFSYPLKMNVDERGSFTEFIKSESKGQVSINISKPGITKGNHWHHSKNEKFLVVSGKALIQFRKINSEKVIEYYVSEEKLEVVDIPTGYTHNIINIGDKDLVTVMWANESFNKDKPDTYFEEVIKDGGIKSEKA